MNKFLIMLTCINLAHAGAYQSKTPIRDNNTQLVSASYSVSADEKVCESVNQHAGLKFSKTWIAVKADDALIQVINNDKYGSLRIYNQASTPLNRLTLQFIPRAIIQTDAFNENGTPSSANEYYVLFNMDIMDKDFLKHYLDVFQELKNNPERFQKEYNSNDDVLANKLLEEYPGITNEQGITTYICTDELFSGCTFSEADQQYMLCPNPDQCSSTLPSDTEISKSVIQLTCDNLSSLPTDKKIKIFRFAPNTNTCDNLSSLPTDKKIKMFRFAPKTNS